MIEYTPDQILFVENFTNKRDSLTLEVGLLTHEKEQLEQRNQDLGVINSSLQSGIDEMNNNASKLGFEQAEIISELKLVIPELKNEIQGLEAKRELIKEDLEEKNKSLYSLVLLINTIKSSTEDTTNQIRKMGNDLNIYTARVETASSLISDDSVRIKGFTNDLETTIDSERKVNYERSREIDARENAVIGREKLVELKYAEVVKNLNK